MVVVLSSFSEPSFWMRNTEIWFGYWATTIVLPVTAMLPTSGLATAELVTLNFRGYSVKSAVRTPGFNVPPLVTPR